MKYKAIEQTVDAVQITPDIDMIAPNWFAKKMNKQEIMIDRVWRDGTTAVYWMHDLFYWPQIQEQQTCCKNRRLCCKRFSRSIKCSS